jgi:hypothetical protein
MGSFRNVAPTAVGAGIAVASVIGETFPEFFLASDITVVFYKSYKLGSFRHGLVDDSRGLTFARIGIRHGQRGVL